MMMENLRVVAALGVGLATALAAGPVSAQVKVGAVLSVSGPASFLGDPEKKTLEIYVRQDQRRGRGQRPETAAHRLR